MVAYSKPRSVLPMLFALFVFLQATVAFSQHANHHVHRSPEAMGAHLDEMTNLLQERANNIAIKGVTGTVSPRLEIRDLKKNADQWNLYLLGMERFKAKAKNDRLSYYQIAGVHGRPYVTWNNFPTPLVNTAGFCPHSQTLFGSWHRPYLAIYEQAWYQSVQEVIATFPSSQQTRWKNAANGLRMPFWDWAKVAPTGESNVPTAIRDQTVSVTKPSGEVTIANPLYSYTWGSSLPAEMGGGPYGNWPTTLRRPVSNPTRSNNNEFSARMKSLRLSLRDRVYGLFMSGASWGDVSTSAKGVRTSQNGNNPDSFESVHDAVHVTAGGETGGHMYYLDYSSFDPVFWLHHTNIDRLLAMYQVLSPNTYVSNGNINRGMAQWNAGEPKNSNSPLKPFTKNTAGDYYTSENIRNTRVLGYTYPETNDSPTASSVRTTINNLYGPNASSRKRSITGQYEGRPFRAGDYNTVLSVIANKYALDGSYEIHCFLGSGNSTSNSTSTAPTSNPNPISNITAPYSNSTLDTESPDYVGTYSILGMTNGDGSNSSYPVVTEGCIPLTTALQGKQAYGELSSLGPDEVTEYLKNNLHYKVIGPGGAEIPADDVPGLHLYVKSAPITPPKSIDELPELGEYILLPKVTANKPAGKPYTWTPSPVEVSPPYPTLPWDKPSSEPGYCVTKQTVEYVDASGNFLYKEEL